MIRSPGMIRLPLSIAGVAARPRPQQKDKQEHCQTYSHKVTPDGSLNDRTNKMLQKCYRKKLKFFDQKQTKGQTERKNEKKKEKKKEDRMPIFQGVLFFKQQTF